MIASELQAGAERATRLLAQHGQTIAFVDSATGGLIATAWLAVPGASACCVGGTGVYTGRGRRRLLGSEPANLVGLRPAMPAFVKAIATRRPMRLNTMAAVAEAGAAGPIGPEPSLRGL